MSRLTRFGCGAALACATLYAQAQNSTGAGNTPPQNVQLQQQEIAKGDPARWYKEDGSAAEQAKTLRKEIGAALAEAKIACAKQPAAERAACLDTARATYKQDMEKVAQTVATSGK